jgi:hypothetical protein
MEILSGLGSRETGRTVVCELSWSRIIGANSPKGAKPPSVAPGGTFGMRGLVFLRMVTLD